MRNLLILFLTLLSTTSFAKNVLTAKVLDAKMIGDFKDSYYIDGIETSFIDFAEREDAVSACTFVGTFQLKNGDTLTLLEAKQETSKHYATTSLLFSLDGTKHGIIRPVLVKCDNMKFEEVDLDGFNKNLKNILVLEWKRN